MAVALHSEENMRKPYALVVLLLLVTASSTRRSVFAKRSKKNAAARLNIGLLATNQTSKAQKEMNRPRCRVPI